jgi:hypothetical protein
MTGSYLEKLRALKSEKGTVGALPKLPKRRPPIAVGSDATTDGGFDSFDSTQSAGFSNFPAPYSRTISALEARCPDLVPVDRWQQTIADGQHYLARWDDQAKALGWTAKDLFGLHRPPANPHPRYSRLSRYDEAGLIWLVDGRKVLALTAETAAIQNPSGSITTYRRYAKPALGPAGAHEAHSEDGPRRDDGGDL